MNEISVLLYRQIMRRNHFASLFFATVLVMLLLAACKFETTTVTPNSPVMVATNDSLAIKEVLNEEQPVADSLYYSPFRSVRAYFKNSYCGGAYPSEEILREYETTYPLRSSMLVLENVKTPGNFVLVYTDGAGDFQAALEEGTYNYYMSDRFDRTMGAHFSSDCPQWMAWRFGQLEIGSAPQQIYEMEYDFGCNPCEGPRP